MLHGMQQGKAATASVLNTGMWGARRVISCPVISSLSNWLSVTALLGAQMLRMNPLGCAVV